MVEYKYITLRDNPALKETAAKWFSSKWKAPTEAYLQCMSDYLTRKTELGWYLCLDGEKIIAGLGVVENDFHNRKDLSPNVCAVYTEQNYRKQGIAGKLLNMVVCLLTIRAFMKDMVGAFCVWSKVMAKNQCQECIFTIKV